MSDFSIRDKCKVNTNKDADTFVGIMCDDGDISIHFPLGYHISSDEKELRKDILLLVNTIESTLGHTESILLDNSEECNQTGFPIQAYLKVIYDYYERGYYREREVEYNVSQRGKINWARTIKTQRAVLQDDEAYYLNFVTKRNSVNENELIALIHEFCVYESFSKIGWLFTGGMPRKPQIKRNNKLFFTVLADKLSRTFNDKNKALFTSMITIIRNMQDEAAATNYRYGTYRFEYVWEALIDRVYGIEGKDAYFPKTTWRVNGKRYDNASLEPDSIMIRGNDIYVLDAKYYKYGASKMLWDLPESTSINKQITYGEYIANNKTANGKVFNAFLMPFDANSDIWKTGTIYAIGEASGDWRDNTKLYEHIQGIMIDVKYLMQITVKEDTSEINRLATCIEAAIGDI